MYHSLCYPAKLLKLSVFSVFISSLLTLSSTHWTLSYPHFSTHTPRFLIYLTSWQRLILIVLRFHFKTHASPGFYSIHPAEFSSMPPSCSVSLLCWPLLLLFFCSPLKVDISQGSATGLCFSFYILTLPDLTLICFSIISVVMTLGMCVLLILPWCCVASYFLCSSFGMCPGATKSAYWLQFLPSCSLPHK